jgi:ABC-type antimicrobial peptide transport system permease subunit
MYQLIKVDRKTNDVMVGILGTIVAMGVLNTILMSVLERTREFGVMLSIGMKPGRVGALVLTEGLLLGITGAILGFAAAIAIGYSWVVHGIDYSFFMGSEAMEMGGVTLSTMMYGSFAWWRMSMYGIGAVVFSVLAAVWPAIHVARLRPVEALHHV